MLKMKITLGMVIAVSTGCTGDQLSTNVQHVMTDAQGSGSDAGIPPPTSTNDVAMCGNFVVPLGMPLCDSAYTPWVPDNDPNKGIIWSATETTSGGGGCESTEEGSALSCNPAPATREITIE